ncbi:MAG: aspartate/glutamate racemase family protein [bacterium]|nr:aspartate/glutamate racemase family protein [bacterium]
MRIRYIEPIGIDIHVPRAVRVLEKHASSGVFIEVVHLDLPPELAGPMLSPVPLYMNELIATVIEAEQSGTDAAIIGCCSDPALMEAQRSAKIPVLGPLQASAALAAGRGLNLGILFPDEHDWQITANWVRRNLRAYGLSEVVSDIAFVPMHVEGEDSLIGNLEVTAEMVQERFRHQLHEHAVPAARAMLERSPVDAILFGCTIWGGMIREVEHLIDAVCIDPMIASLHLAEAQVRMTKLA